METQSALGSALQAAFKLLSPTGGRMSVFQTQLPNLGVGALQSREDPNQRASAKVRALMMRFLKDINEKCAGFHTVGLKRFFKFEMCQMCQRQHDDQLLQCYEK